jgi:hypothetical protein
LTAADGGADHIFGSLPQEPPRITRLVQSSASAAMLPFKGASL